MYKNVSITNTCIQATGIMYQTIQSCLIHLYTHIYLCVLYPSFRGLLVLTFTSFQSSMSFNFTNYADTLSSSGNFWMFFNLSPDIFLRSAGHSRWLTHLFLSQEGVHIVNRILSFFSWAFIIIKVLTTTFTIKTLPKGHGTR